MIYVLIISSILLTTAGQIFLKLASLKKSKYYLFSGYFLFIVVVLISYFLMHLIMFKYFTVIMSLNYLTVFMTSVLIFKEQINRFKVIGVLSIVLGIVIFYI